MSVRLVEGLVRLAGDCAVEDAEALLALLQEHPSAPVGLRGCTRLHLAVAQVLLAARRPVADSPVDPFLRDHFMQLLG
jgi:hypothetical protein